MDNGQADTFEAVVHAALCAAHGQQDHWPDIERKRMRAALLAIGLPELQRKADAYDAPREAVERPAMQGRVDWYGPCIMVTSTTSDWFPKEIDGQTVALVVPPQAGEG